MPENLPKPRNIFEAINQNIYILGENLKTLSEQVAHTEQEVIALSLMFKAPEQPNAHGEEGASIVNSGQ
jgi:hypothetical protein